MYAGIFLIISYLLLIGVIFSILYIISYIIRSFRNV